MAVIRFEGAKWCCPRKKLSATTNVVTSYPSSVYLSLGLDRLRAAQDALKAEHPHVGLDFVPSPHIPHYVPGVVEYEEWLAFAKIPEVVDAVSQLIDRHDLCVGFGLVR